MKKFHFKYHTFCASGYRENDRINFYDHTFVREFLSIQNQRGSLHLLTPGVSDRVVRIWHSAKTESRVKAIDWRARGGGVRHAGKKSTREDGEDFRGFGCCSSEVALNFPSNFGGVRDPPKCRAALIVGAVRENL